MSSSRAVSSRPGRHRADVRTKTFREPLEILIGFAMLDVVTLLLLPVVLLVGLGGAVGAATGVISGSTFVSALAVTFFVTVAAQIGSVAFGGPVGRLIDRRLAARYA